MALSFSSAYYLVYLPQFNYSPSCYLLMKVQSFIQVFNYSRIGLFHHVCFFIKNCMNDETPGDEIQALTGSGLRVRPSARHAMSSNRTASSLQANQGCALIHPEGDINANLYKLKELSLGCCNTGFSYTHSKCDRKTIAP